MKSIIGENLKKLRINANLNQNELAKKINITQTLLSNFENGNKLPSLDVLLRFANFFNVSLDWLCGISKEQRFSTMADVISVFLSFVSLNPDSIPFELNVESNLDPILEPGNEEDIYHLNTELLTRVNHTCTLQFSGFTFGYNDGNALGHLCEFIKNWNDTRKQLETLTDKEIVRNYSEMWLEKQLKHYSAIPVKVEAPGSKELQILKSL